LTLSVSTSNALVHAAITTTALVGVLSALVGTLPERRPERWLAAMAAVATAFGLVSVPLSLSDAATQTAVVAWIPALSRLRLLLVGLGLLAWTRYAERQLAASANRLEGGAVLLAVALAALGLLPGLAYLGEVQLRTVGGLARYEAVLGPLGRVMPPVLAACYLPLGWRLVRAWRSGRAGGGLHVAAYGVMFLLGLNDVLVAVGLLDTPRLLALGMALPVAAVGLGRLKRLVREAGELAALRARLESQVEDRSRALARSHEALNRAEKLAAVGELAAGVAHEVNSPATAAAANVEYLIGHLRAGAPPADAVEAAEDALLALRRITEIVRRLSGAARLGSVPTETRELPVGPLVRESVRLARTRCPGHVRVEEGPGGDLLVLADDGLLVQVLVNLVVNGAQAVPPGRPGRVAVSATRQGSRVIITVEDDGDGMRPDVLERVFEPFFTTKPVGVGTGLGLSISRGLLASIGGVLSLASEPGRGTRALIELPAAAESEARRH
jgi:signal transduction histidine kinase